MNANEMNNTGFPVYEEIPVSTKELIVDAQGFEQINLTPWQLVLCGLGLYFGHSLVASLIAIIVSGILRASGKTPHVENISTFSGLFGGIICVVIFLIIIRKHIKPILKEFTQGATWKKALIYFAVMIGAIVLYSMLLAVLKINQTTSANQSSINTMMYLTPVMAGFYVCILAPIIEEFTFRFCLFRAIAKKNPKVALIIIACIFGGIHLLASLTTGTFVEDLVTLPIYLVGGVGLTFAYYREKRIGVSMLTHFLYNTFSFLMNVLTMTLLF